MKNGLYISPTEFRSFADVAEPLSPSNGSLSGEIATRLAAGDLTSFFGLLPNADPILRQMGKQIEVYCDPNVTFQGKRTGGLRLRPPQNGHNNHNPAPILAWTMDQAIAECAKVGVDAVEMKSTLKAQGITAWNSLRCTPLVQHLIAERTPKDDDGRGLDEGPPMGDDTPFGWLIGFVVATASAASMMV